MSTTAEADAILNRWGDTIAALKSVPAALTDPALSLAERLYNDTAYFTSPLRYTNAAEFFKKVSNNYNLARPQLMVLVAKYPLAQANTSPAAKQEITGYGRLVVVPNQGTDYTTVAIAVAVGGAALLALASGKPAKKRR